MKKRFIVYLFASLMALSFAVPAMAADAVAVEPTYAAAEQEIAPRTEMTQFFWRTYNGQLQFRIWSITNGRWLTEWTNF